MTVLGYILCAVIGYLLGNVQTGVIVARAKGGIDLRSYGSGGSGATNALRVLGRHAGLMTLLGDFAKGLLASALGLWILGANGGMVAALFVVLGHIWPAFFGFRGGKGVATALGALLVLLPWHTLLLFSVGVAVILLTKIVSLASIIAALVFMVAAVITGIVQSNLFLVVFSVLMAGLVVYAHHGNIDRLLKGTENKLSSGMFKKK